MRRQSQYSRVKKRKTGRFRDLLCLVRQFLNLLMSFRGASLVHLFIPCSLKFNQPLTTTLHF